MKGIRRFVLVLAACVCMAAVMAPLALAAQQNSGGAGTSNQMHAQQYGGQSPQNNGQMQGAPSGGQMNGNSVQTGTQNQNQNQGQPPAGMMRNQTGQAPSGGAGFGGNTTRHQPPAGFDGNTTTGRPPSGMGGNRTFGHDGFGGNSSFTPPEPRDFGNLTASDMNAGPGMFGNSTEQGRGHGGMMAGNQTPPPDTPADGQAPLYGSDQSTEQQQSRDDLIADLISKLQALLAEKK